MDASPEYTRPPSPAADQGAHGRVRTSFRTELVTKREDVVDASWAGGVEPQYGVAPHVRIGKSKWFNLLWLIPIGFFLLIVGAAVAKGIRELPRVQEFIAQYPGESDLPDGAPVGLPAWLGWQHFLNLFLMIFIIRSGLTIIADHPRFCGRVSAPARRRTRRVVGVPVSTSLCQTLVMAALDAIPNHVFDALGTEPIVLEDRIGGSVMVVEKRPENGPITLITAGASQIPTDSGERVELAVEVVDGQQGAALVAMRIVCDDIANNRRVPPMGTPWRNSEPFLSGTGISAILATGSRWGAAFDEVRSEDGEVLGRVCTLRLLTDAEASHIASSGWDSLRDEAGSVDALLDVTRGSAVGAAGLPGAMPVFLSKLHAEHPPRWVTFTGREVQSVTGLESEAYMDDASNHEVWSVGSFRDRFPMVDGFLRVAVPGQTALFADESGTFAIEDD